MDAKHIIDRYNVGKGQRSNFESYWQTLHDYFYIESEDLNRSYAQGSELDAKVLFDSTTLESADVFASGFMSYLTPPTSKWFRLSPRSRELREDKEVMGWFEDVADECHLALNRSNYYDTMFSNYKSVGVYGTSVVYAEEDLEDDIRFYNMPNKQVVINEDSKGRIAEYFIEFEYTAQQVLEKFGVGALTNEMREELRPESSSTKKYKYVLYIAKRSARDVLKKDKKNLPIQATWVDVANKQVVDESGYNEFPAFCARFEKRPFIAWGFSPAMKSLPFARVLNAMAKTNLRGTMKGVDPAVAIPSDAFIMPFNQNPRAVNVYRKDKMTGGDIFSLGTFGNPQLGLQSVEYYSAMVKRVMYNDVFLAFDRITKQMNNPEVQERINEKMTMLGSATGRFISEMLNPAVQRTIGILMRKGKLPPPPDALIENPDYEIDCISQLAQAQRRSEFNSLMTGLGLVGQIAQFDQSVLDKVNADKVVDMGWDIVGAPNRVLRTDEDIENLRSARAEMAQQQMAMEQLKQGMETAKIGTEADANVAKAVAE